MDWLFVCVNESELVKQGLHNNFQGFAGEQTFCVTVQPPVISNALPESNSEGAYHDNE
jgi:hypothetical protein